MGALPEEGTNLRAKFANLMAEVANAVIVSKEEVEASAANSANVASRTMESFLAEGSLKFMVRKRRSGWKVTSALSSIVNDKMRCAKKDGWGDLRSMMMMMEVGCNGRMMIW